MSDKMKTLNDTIKELEDLKKNGQKNIKNWGNMSMNATVILIPTHPMR